MKLYKKADADIVDFLHQALLMKEISEINFFNIRYGVMLVSAIDKDGTPLRAFKTLPYKVHICSSSDVLIKNYDVEITIDEHYWNSLIDDSEKIAVFFSALVQLYVKTDRDGNAKYDENAHIKVGKRNPDLVIECFSKSATKFGLDSPDVKMLISSKSEYENIFKYAC